jgi:hypothetical protein
MIAGHPGTVLAVMVPKAEDPALLEALKLHLPADTGVIPLIETAAGVVRAPDVCAMTGVVRPLFGSRDLAAQLGADHQIRDACGMRVRPSCSPPRPAGAPLPSMALLPASPRLATPRGPGSRGHPRLHRQALHTPLPGRHSKPAPFPVRCWPQMGPRCHRGGTRRISHGI